MALWRWVLIWLWTPVAASALELRPAEPPPKGFDARQYIDSRGCVFLRDDGGGWTARLARDGSAICGYPPSLSMRGLDGKPRLRALDPNAGKTPAELAAEALERVVTTQLRAGELASDPRPLQVLPDMGPEPHSTQPIEDLKATLRAAPAVRQEMSRDLQPNRRLCELLGYDGKPGAGPAGTGPDPTRGYCGSLPDTALSRLTFARPLGDIQTAPPRDAGTAARPDPRKGAGTVAANPPAKAVRSVTPPPAPKAAIGQARAVVPGKAAKAAKAQVNSAERMIPPGARYVQLGLYPDAAQADQAVRRAMALGYPVLRGKERGQTGQPLLVMAGPFDSREAIVRALDGLRKAGFRDAFAR